MVGHRHACGEDSDARVGALHHWLAVCAGANLRCEASKEQVQRDEGRGCWEASDEPEMACDAETSFVKSKGEASRMNERPLGRERVSFFTQGCRERDASIRMHTLSGHGGELFLYFKAVRLHEQRQGCRALFASSSCHLSPQV